MDTNKKENLKKKLEEEKKVLIEELKTVGVRSDANQNDWEPVPTKMDISEADRNEVADKIEEFGNNMAIEKDLEIRYTEIIDALKKMEEGNYGICEIGGEEIEEDRLNANPAAKTCKSHMN